MTVIVRCGESAEFLLTRPLRDVTKTLLGLPSVQLFLLTRPLRDVTYTDGACSGNPGISTHTPLAGRDDFDEFYDAGKIHFYSHAPCGT